MDSRCLERNVDVSKSYADIQRLRQLIPSALLHNLPCGCQTFRLYDRINLMKRNSAPSFRFLFWVTIANYVAQVPYYFHNYYIPFHALPTFTGLILLAVTLVWFLVGYAGVCKGRSYGYYTLLSFLIVEALFYGLSLVSGAFLFQMQNPSLLIKAVFLMGYISGAVSAYYAYSLISRRS